MFYTIRAPVFANKNRLFLPQPEELAYFEPQGRQNVSLNMSCLLRLHK